MYLSSHEQKCQFKHFLGCHMHIVSADNMQDATRTKLSLATWQMMTRGQG
jgi:hypothetical protein